MDKKTKSSMKKILVKWIDSSAGTEWIDPQEVIGAGNNLFCYTLGWLLKETKDVVVIVQSYDETKEGKPNHINNYMIIPKVSIITKKILK